MNIDANDTMIQLLMLLPINYREISEGAAASIIAFARDLDPTDSDLAAFLRDAIRDNTDLTI